MLRLQPIYPAVKTVETLLLASPAHVVVVPVAGGGGLPHAVRDAGDHLGQPLVSTRDRPQR